jgi:hypothetical protein
MSPMFFVSPQHRLDARSGYLVFSKYSPLPAVRDDKT